MVSAKNFPISCPEKLFYACHNPKRVGPIINQLSNKTKTLFIEGYFEPHNNLFPP